ncbi:hypothetical protein J2S43_005874 [Catenuloplanes nepalensis]|uniref:Right handed beta helix domain-containing protein n=1 Tax=Catenuloplanes nepalensis TaxID=587533 RepID=A0ABT9N0Y3_9ACTN|nr:hypothetical protein [Catenuloplanes nepalensis]MDP9797362.1 hypothetical protein [Catenuloplanes nepalensis]
MTAGRRRALFTGRRRVLIVGVLAVALVAVAGVAYAGRAGWFPGDEPGDQYRLANPVPPSGGAATPGGAGGLGASPATTGSPDSSSTSTSAPSSPSGAAPAAPPAPEVVRPGEGSTGVPDGVTLTKYTGPLRITAAGTVIDGKQIDGCLDVRARDVVIKRSKLTCGDIMIKIEQKTANLTIEDSDLDGAQTGFVAGYWNYTLRRVDVHNIEEGPRVGSNVIIEDSWFHSMHPAASDEAHQDLMQTNGGSNSTIRGNVFDATSTVAGVSFNAAFQVGAEFEPLENVLVEENWFNGGGYTVNIRNDPQISNVLFRNNVFGPRHGYGEVSRADSPGIIWEDSNVSEADRRPVW